LMGKMNPKVVLSVLLLLAATSVLFTGFTATAATSAASFCYWDPATKQNVCLSGFTQSTTSQPTPQLPYCPNYPNYPNYQNYQNYPCYPSYPSYPYYPYNRYYPGYGYGYYAGYGYEVVTTTQTVMATSYSTVTQTNEVTSTTTSIPAPVTVTTSATVTTTTTTRDTTAEMLYGSLMAVFLALFLATLVLLVGSRSRGSRGLNPQPLQAAVAAPAQAHIATSHKCSACGTDVDPGTKFCGNCGAQLKAK
jgi:hypothetical protein